MNFDNQTLTTLRSHAGQNNRVVLSVINKIGQEFTVQGYIPKAYSRYKYSHWDINDCLECKGGGYRVYEII